ncbi:MAG: hypothetical protein Q9217_001123 [Psora testacea]
MGKLNYGYRKITASKDKPACAACDITHGGLHLDETVEWKKVKEEIASSGNVELKQLHRDEMGPEIKQFVEAKGLRYPMVLASDQGTDYRLVLNNDELTACGGNAQQFVQKLRDKGVFSAPASL